MDLGPHSGFIIASYALTAAAVLGLLLWVIFDRRKLEADLARLAEQGISRARRHQPSKGTEADRT
ncbi:heme exporter protein CcmD [Roseibium litorale]|uniref:Heme exporter protein D n=1 Tax=Roseibium litorale TaxID=2803841 RepID=A0ABR9CNV1_9HYPH|nr:heme exporter protein CcmD [Roseibium litorale]MBD8892105.1 heme exporter protein CcmD [Roseibium litorale]